MLKLKTSSAVVIALFSGALSLTACNSGTSSSPVNPTANTTTVAKVSAAYVELESATTLAAIPNSAYAIPNVILFGFADPSSNTINSTYLAAIQKAISNEQKGAINFLSIGGKDTTAQSFTTIGIPSVVSNIVAQVKAYNQQLSGGRIQGVDLDLENAGWTAETINQLATGFKAYGLFVSIAPHVALAAESNITDVDSSNPTNLGLSASGFSNVYAKAVANNLVDYIMVQTYDTPGWTVGGAAENQRAFLANVAKALNKVSKPSCYSAGSTLCIPNHTKIVLGEPSNASASTSAYNIYASDGTTQYNQAATLKTLTGDWESSVRHNFHIKGLMNWSLNHDYAPSDTSAKAGALSAAGQIVGAVTDDAWMPVFNYTTDNFYVSFNVVGSDSGCSNYHTEGNYLVSPGGEINGEFGTYGDGSGTIFCHIQTLVTNVPIDSSTPPQVSLIAQENGMVDGDDGTFWDSHDTPPTYVATGYSATTNDHDNQAYIDFYISQQGGIVAPMGSYTTSCNNIQFNAATLTATCASGPSGLSGSTVTSSLTYTTVCATGSTVSNINGYLSCDSYSPALQQLTQLDEAPVYNANNWLAPGNSSCVIQSITSSDNSFSDTNITNIEAMCMETGGSYRQSNQNPQQCSNLGLTNNDGHLDCIGSN